MSDEPRAGTLYLVSTPIGNLEDITVRAAKILAGVNRIAAEDTRTTSVLLQHLQIQKPMISYFSYNEIRRIPDILGFLRAGESVAVVSDAGTPGISDPAFRIVRACLDEQIPVIAIPGATAFVPALIVSGLPVDRFIFEGFLPLKKGRKTKLGKLRSEERTVVLYESPHRLLKTLRELLESFGDRRIAVSRELTKKFEETFRGTIAEAIPYFESRAIRGEFVLVIAGHDEA
jgi:16S rRNA (cytidine1402-2'-O)-methyltransferase